MIRSLPCFAKAEAQKNERELKRVPRLTFHHPQNVNRWTKLKTESTTVRTV